MPLVKARPRLNLELLDTQTEHLINPGKNDIYLPLGTVFLLKRVVSDTVGNLRLYNSIAQRDADRNRPDTIDPTGNHGLILELGFATSFLLFDLSPIVSISCESGIIPAIFTASQSKYLLLDFTFLPFK